MTSSYAEYIDPFQTPEKELQSARILFGAALRYNPAELYDKINRPTPDVLPRITEIAILAEMPRPVQEKAIIASEKRLLIAGISDVGDAMSVALSQHVNLSLEEAVAIGAHPKTIDFIASASRNRQDVTSSILQHGILSEDEIAIVKDPEFQPAIPVLPRQILYSGCPVARSEHSSTEAQPVFKAFVPWAAELSIRAIYNHKA